MRWLDGSTNSMDMSFEQTPGDGDGQGSLACCSPWGCKESDTTELLNNNRNMHQLAGARAAGDEQEGQTGRKG